MSKKKTPMSDLVHQNCTLPARQRKNEAIENNQPFEAGLAAITEKNCKKTEEFFKWKTPKS